VATLVGIRLVFSERAHSRTLISGLGRSESQAKTA
jgi:hypothetical protein